MSRKAERVGDMHNKILYRSDKKFLFIALVANTCSEGNMPMICTTRYDVFSPVKFREILLEVWYAIIHIYVWY
jgi:hypothetical protein